MLTLKIKTAIIIFHLIYKPHADFIVKLNKKKENETAYKATAALRNFIWYLYFNFL